MFDFTVDDKIRLELIAPNHAQGLFDLVNQNRTYLRQWLPWVDGTQAVDDTQQFIAICQQQYKKKGELSTIIFYEKQMVGIIGLQELNRMHQRVCIGYWLAAPFQGLGIMTKTCAYMVNYCFEELNMNRVEIRCASQNYKSQAIPKRLGFKEEGTLRAVEYLYDHFVDHIVYSQLKNQGTIIEYDNIVSS